MIQVAVKAYSITMISAWKRFINKTDGIHESVSSSTNGTVPPGVQKLDKELQRKFARGVNYNMKIVIKGDTQVGKSSLFLRLKGYGFEDNYTPTEHLNVTSINWNYKATDDIVKIDLWEAIDSSSKKTINYVDLKLAESNEKPDSSTTGGKGPAQIITSTNLHLNGAASDSIPESAKRSLADMRDNIDVYKAANAALLVMDMNKSWTFKYIQNELPNVPNHVPVLIIANHRDQGHHRTVSSEQVRAFVEGLDRGPGGAIVMYTEASMKNGFGLRMIENFFNIPFLKLQEESLLKQLEVNRSEFLTTIEELNLLQESTNREYEQYLELETLRRRQQADAMSPVNSGIRLLDEAAREQIRNATMSSDDIDKRKNVRSIESNNDLDRRVSEAQAIANQKFVNDRLPSIVIGAKCPLPENKSIQVADKTIHSSQQLNDINKDSNDCNQSDDDSDDEEIPKANPLVADYQSDLDSDDQLSSAKA